MGVIFLCGTVLFSIHDIDVNNFRLVDSFMEVRPFLRPERTHLVVIPGRKHALGDLREESDFRAWLLFCREKGYPLFCHGYVHYRPATKFYLKARIINAITRQEAEFAGLPLEESRMRLRHAMEAWEALDVGPPDGFTPPTWWSSKHLPALLKNWDVPELETRWGYQTLCHGGKNCFRWKLPLVFSSHHLGWYRFSLLVNRILFVLLPLRWLRVVYHPTDFVTRFNQERLEDWEDLCKIADRA
jgi:hypothetical protein